MFSHRVIYKLYNQYLSKISFSTNISQNIKLRFSNKKVGAGGWFLLIIPTSTFALGSWQVQRKRWKETMISQMQQLTQATPIRLPENLDELKSLEYRPVSVEGEFLHDQELHVGPRSLLFHGDSASQSQLISTKSKQNQGYLVITPFKLADRDATILVNRGWVPNKLKDPKTRENGQVSGIVNVTGVVRLHENRPNFMPKNNVQNNQWFYRDLHQMANITGAEPVYLDATIDNDVEGGPIGGQTRVTLRNEHMSYILTWYGLSAATSYLWYQRFIQRVKL